MIRVTIDLVPFGNEDKRTTLAGIDIINDGEDSNRTFDELGSYNVILTYSPSAEFSDGEEEAFVAKVKGWNRNGDVVFLLKRCLEELEKVIVQ